MTDHPIPPATPQDREQDLEHLWEHRENSLIAMHNGRYEAVIRLAAHYKREAEDLKRESKRWPLTRAALDEIKELEAKNQTNWLYRKATRLEKSLNDAVDLLEKCEDKNQELSEARSKATNHPRVMGSNILPPMYQELEAKNQLQEKLIESLRLDAAGYARLVAENRELEETLAKPIEETEPYRALKEQGQEERRLLRENSELLGEMIERNRELREALGAHHINYPSPCRLPMCERTALEGEGTERGEPK